MKGGKKMNQKTKTIGIALALAFVLILLISVMSAIMAKPAEMIEQTRISKEKLIANGSIAKGTITVKGAHDSKSFQNGRAFYYEYTGETSNKVYCPSINDIQLYCIQKGGRLKSTGNLVSDVEAKNGNTGSTRGSLPRAIYSNPYYVCNNKHEVLNAIGAYIVTAPSNFIASAKGTYDYGANSTTFEKGENISEEVRQVAIWLNPATNVGESWKASGAKFSYLDQSQQLSDEAEDYKTYEAELKENVANPIKETTEKEIKINVNVKEQYLIIGPYKLDYVSGIGNNVAFAGISNIQVKGYNEVNANKELKDVELLSYIQDGNEKAFNYFQPTQKEGYVDRSEQSYPVSGKEFFLKIKNPNQGVTAAAKKVNYISVFVEYGYMTATGTKCELVGNQKVAKAVQYDSRPIYSDGIRIGTKRYYRWTVSSSLTKPQKLIDAWGERKYYTVTVELVAKLKETTKPVEPSKPGRRQTYDITLSLGGTVWEDVLDTKMNQADGIKGENDKLIENVKVTLYECVLDKKGNVQYQDGKLISQVADLLSEDNRKQMTEEEIARRINPQFTDKNGYYQFDGLDPSNKYYVAFEYNGQVYMPTEYLVTGKKEDGTLVQQNSVQDMVTKLPNKEIWQVNSKVTENQTTRSNYNSQFKDIGSSPKNYQSSNSLNSGKLLKEDGKYYNETYTINELMGFELQADGTYKDDGVHLIDGFYALNKDGRIETTTKINEGIISKSIKEYIQKKAAYPNKEEMLAIYKNIAGNDSTLWKKLQYIEDCKISSYTGSPFKNSNVELYPVYNDFAIDSKIMTIPGKGSKKAIYKEQLHINSGLWRRQQVDLALRKDIYKAATKINGKTEIYNYNKRSDDEKYWQIELRLQDYNQYYGTNYNRELYIDDYKYRSANTNQSGKDLELYITYKITVRNNSQGILGKVTEVVDYYDNDYTYQPGLSWVMYQENNEDKQAQVTVKKDDYEKMMSTLCSPEDAIPYARKAQVNSSSIYGKNAQSDLEKQYNGLYINGLKEKELASGEEAYIFLTFKVKSDANGPVILDGDDSLKENYAEINGYQTYYANGTVLPNKVEKSHNDVAGIIDYNSNPGNLVLKDLECEKYEKNFENDTDRAKKIKVTVKGTRNINGTVWEDERTQTVSGSVIGDGIRQQNEIGVNGVTVQLVEKLADNKEYVWQTTKTKDGGKYQFSNIIPGNYIVRFVYGNNKDTALTVANGGANAVSYNGQDFKSTIYQKDMKANQEIAGYQEEYYNIQAADSYKQNLSDAKDVWSRRTAVNNYSTNNVTNYKAEVLASPYAQSINEAQIKELMQNTNMVAETAIIVFEGEYNRTNTDGSNTESNGDTLYIVNNSDGKSDNSNAYNGNYTLNNVDFGLTERPKAQLEISKKVAGVKLTHSDGVVAFDTTKAVPDVLWLSGKAYNLSDSMRKNQYKDYYQESIKDAKYNRYSYREEVSKLIASRYKGGNNGLIQITKDEELMHGATIQITYVLTIKNVGETDYTGEDFYYKGVANGKVVTTAANQVLDYVPNNLQYRGAENQGWTVVNVNDLTNNDANQVYSRLVNNSLTETISKFNTMLVTKDLAKALEPGKETDNKTLVLTKVITPENANDDLTYENIAEIVQTSNTVGRRMAYSIVGNQNPTENPSEVDSSQAERIVILPPTGEPYLYLGIGAIAIIILIGGVIIIKKKVIK